MDTIALADEMEQAELECFELYSATYVGPY